MAGTVVLRAQRVPDGRDDTCPEDDREIGEPEPPPSTVEQEERAGRFTRGVPARRH